MKKVRTKPGDSIISVRGLLLVYALLSVLAVVFARTYFMNPLEAGDFPGLFNLVIFFTIPVVLFVFLGISAVHLVSGLIKHRTGSKFQSRILVYLSITALLAGAPPTIITTQFFYEMIRVWQTIKIHDALKNAENFAMDYYRYRLEALERLVREENMDGPLFPAQGTPDLPASGSAGRLSSLAEGVEAVQDFEPPGGAPPGFGWRTKSFAGNGEQKLASPPSLTRGFVVREMPRDRDLIRYVLYPSGGETIRVVSYSLGKGFDENIATIKAEEARIEKLGMMRYDLKNLFLFYYGVFFLPTLLMTLIIAVSLSKMLTQPIVELAEATARVAEGDFSIQIISRPRDELGLLIKSFNAMVRDLESSRNALLQSEKVTMWQDMAQQLAHEIKNPLTPIRLSAERVLRRWKNDPAHIDEILETSMLAVIQEVEGLSGLLTEFRTFARPLEPSHSETNVADVIMETILPYQSSHPKVLFVTEHAAGGRTVKIERRYLSQALANLVINAIDAMNGEGRLEFRTDLVKKRDSYYCRISIKDSGKGIPSPEQSKVLTPYFTTKESGTGLGLPIVERIIVDHGGAVWFHSAPGAGTTFFVDLPAAPEVNQPVPKAVREAAPEQALFQGEKPAP